MVETPEVPERKLFNVKCTKLRPEARDTYRDHAAEFVEIHGGEDGWDVPTGGVARYAVSLDDSGVEAFLTASNLLSLEESATDYAIEEDVSEAAGALYHGIDVDQLAMAKTKDMKPGGISPLLMVADTGASEHTYTKSRELERWTWFKDDARDRQGHGSHCSGGAVYPRSGKFFVSAKVLGDNGSGANSNGIAALYKFARLCRDKGVPGVASLSLGSNSPSEAYRDAVEFCFANGVIVVAAAGNDGFNSKISYPGVYAISVGAHDRSWGRVAFSNRSRTKPDVYALGFAVTGIGLGGRTATMSGTSQATPAVARAMLFAASRGLLAKDAPALARSHGGSSRILDGGKLIKGIPKREKPKPKPPKVTPPSRAGLFSHPSLRRS